MIDQLLGTSLEEREETYKASMMPFRLQTKHSSCRSFMCLLMSSSEKKHILQN